MSQYTQANIGLHLHIINLVLFMKGLVSMYIPALYLLAYVILLFVVGVWLVQAVIPTNLVFLLPLGDNYIKSCHENMFSVCLLNFSSHAMSLSSM